MFNVTFPALGLEFEINRVAFSVAGLDIYWYAIFISIGLLLGMLYFIRFSAKFGINTDRGLDVIILAGIAAIIGARLYYVAFSPYPIDSWQDIFNLRNGGLAIYGAVIAAFVVAIPVCKLRKVPILPMFDVCAIGFLIGQGVGRWGNFFNQEAFGTNTTSIFGMYSEGTASYLQDLLNSSSAQLANVTVDPSLPVHPTFLYESIWCLVCFAALAIYANRRKFNGEIFLLYLFLYGIERAIVEGLRTDSLMIMNARVSQILAIFLSIVAAAVLIYFYANSYVRSKAPFALLPVFVPSDDKDKKEKTKEEVADEESVDEDETKGKAEAEVESEKNDSDDDKNDNNETDDDDE